MVMPSRRREMAKKVVTDLDVCFIRQPAMDFESASPAISTSVSATLRTMK